jgi:hypothetical protein
MSNALIPISEIEKMGSAIAKSGLFGMKTQEQAVSLMLLAQAEGLHPAIAARDYHIIQGRPALKADAMLARFHAAGGKVEWHAYSDTTVSATFTHAQGGSIKIEWTIERAKQADLGIKDNWKKYPRQMLRARVISEGIRTIYPGVSVGIYTPEEVQDFEPLKHDKKEIEYEVVEPAKEYMDDHYIELINSTDTIETIDIIRAELNQNKDKIKDTKTIKKLIATRIDEINAYNARMAAE